jgi:hypothetical protein
MGSPASLALASALDGICGGGSTLVFDAHAEPSDIPAAKNSAAPSDLLAIRPI